MGETMGNGERAVTYRIVAMGRMLRTGRWTARELAER